MSSPFPQIQVLVAFNNGPLDDPTAITGLPNMLSAVDASFETGLGTWSAVSGCTVAQSTAQALDGTHSLAVTASSTTPAEAGSGLYAIVAGQCYVASVAFRAAVTSRASSVFLNFYDANHSFISQVTAFANDIASAFTTVSAKGTAPANAAFASVHVQISSPVAGEVHYVDEAGLFAGGVAPAWTPGGVTLGARNAWTDITSFVRSVGIKRGRQHELAAFQAGTLTLSKVKNDDGRFNPWNTSGPYFGLIGPDVPVQVRVTWLGVTDYLFTGHINTWAPKWDDPVSQTIDIEAADAFRLFNGALLGSLAYQNQVATDGASEFWPFTDAVGSTTAKGAIAGLTGTVVNGTGGQGQALLVTFSGPGTDGPLDLQSTGHIDFGQLTANTTAFTPDCLSLPGIASSGSWSIEFWIKVPTGTTLAPTVFGQNDDLGPPNFTNLAFLSGPPLQLQWIVNNSASVSHACTANFPADGQWHHIVLSYSSTSMSLYIDGVATTTTGTLGTATLTAGQNTRFGLEASLKTAANVCGGFQCSALAYYPSAALSAAQVANHYSLGVGLGGPNFAAVSAQVGQALTIIGWSSGARNILTSVQQAQSNAQSLINTSALSVMQNLERTEEGALFMDGQGRVAFIDRKTLAGANTAHPEYAQPQVYFGDDVANPATVGTWSSGTGGGTWSNGTTGSTWGSMSARFDPGEDMALDDLDVVNQATVTRTGGISQVASVSSKAVKSTSVNALHLTDAASLSHANWIVNKLSTAAFRLRSLLSNLVDAVGEDTVASTPVPGQTYSRVGKLIGLDLMYRVRTRRVGFGFEQDALVEGIEWKITPDSWGLDLALSTSDTYATWGWGGSQ